MDNFFYQSLTAGSGWGIVAATIGVTHLPFHEIAQENAADTVASRIEMLLLQGVLRSGDRLPGERDLAQRLGVSRPTLRSALKVLEGRRLVVARHGEGTFVAELEGPVFTPALADLLLRHPSANTDHLEFRRDFEAWTARMAARRATASDRAILTEIVAAMEVAHAAGDAEREAALDVELHVAIAEAAHNVVAIHVARSLYRLLASGVFGSRSRLYDRAGARDGLLGEHRGLVEAIVAGDATAAAARAEAHVDGVARRLAEQERAEEREALARMRWEQFVARDGRLAGLGHAPAGATGSHEDGSAVDGKTDP